MSTARSAAGLLLGLGLWAGVAYAECTAVDHSHAAWTATLTRWVRDGQVDYAGLQRYGEPALSAYLATLSGACGRDYERWTREERLAYWINAYNAFTARLILDNYPIDSIRTIGWLPGAAFRERFIPMQGLKGGVISLNDIEHGTLRSAFREPRIHFALVCAARSCPVLRSEAYRAADLDRQLDDQGRTFLRDPAKNRVDVPGRTLYLSPIFNWFREDFERDGGSLVAFVGPYLDGATPGADWSITFNDYDWRLNERGQAAAR
jgi:hypothetical protein